MYTCMPVGQDGDTYTGIINETLKAQLTEWTIPYFDWKIPYALDEKYGKEYS